METRAIMLRKPASTFRDLLVWQKAHEFALQIYKYTATFPKSESYGLRSQMRRAAVSIPANIAEGFKKRSKLDKRRYLNIAQGSVEESRYYLILANDLDYGEVRESSKTLENVSRLLSLYDTLSANRFSEFSFVFCILDFSIS